MWSIYTGDNVCEQLPTPEYWDKLQAILEFTYPYERLAITFNPQMGYTDVERHQFLSGKGPDPSDSEAAGADPAIGPCEQPAR